MPQPLDSIAAQLRAAVLRSDHEKAKRLTADYATAVREHWGSLSSAQQAKSALPEQSLELLTWAREMTLMQQAITTQHLSLLETASRYQRARAQYVGSAALERQS